MSAIKISFFGDFNSLLNQSPPKKAILLPQIHKIFIGIFPYLEIPSKKGYMSCQKFPFLAIILLERSHDPPNLVILPFGRTNRIIATRGPGNNVMEISHTCGTLLLAWPPGIVALPINPINPLGPRRWLWAPDNGPDVASGVYNYNCKVQQEELHLRGRLVT